MVIRRDVHVRGERSEPSDLYGWSAILRNTLPLFGLFWLAPFLADVHPYLPWMLAPLIGLVVCRITVVMHDCTHHTLFASRRLNNVIGSLLGAITGVDFRSFSEQHWNHHRLYGQRGDPQGFHYINLNSMTSGEFRWHLVRPLVGLNLRYTLAESVLAPKNLTRLVRTGEIALVVLVQLAFLAIVTGGGRHVSLAALPFVSTATFGLFFSQLRGIAEHGIVDTTAHTRCVRSHAPNWLDRVLLYDVNFNYHKEHHEHPEIPSCHLPAARHETKMPPTATSMFGTLRAMYGGMRRSHG